MYGKPAVAIRPPPPKVRIYLAKEPTLTFHYSDSDEEHANEKSYDCVLQELTFFDKSRINSNLNVINIRKL